MLKNAVDKILKSVLRYQQRRKQNILFLVLVLENEPERPEVFRE